MSTFVNVLWRARFEDEQLSLGISLNFFEESKNCMYYLTSGVVAFFMSHASQLLTSSSCSDLNRLVMDFLVIEGYKTTAEEFSKEAGLEAPVDFDSIENRMNIREALQRGDVGDAITRVNDLNPDVSVPLSFLVRPFETAARGLNLSCTTPRPLGVDGETLHQNFSLQYDLHLRVSV